MARPKKETIDYFSHDSNASEGRTITILENHFGHEGYSAWFKLLERVSVTRNHVIDIRNPEDFEFLSAKLKFTPVRLREILDKIACLQGIDQQLYKAGYIWCQNFIDRLEPVYKTRNQDLPIKPEFVKSETELIGKETEFVKSEIPQTKLNYSKVNNSKEKKTIKKSESERLQMNVTKKVVTRSYNPLELKTSDWYKTEFHNRYPQFLENDWYEAITWLGDHPGRQLTKSFLINWAKKLPPQHLTKPPLSRVPERYETPEEILAKKGQFD